MCLWSNNLQGHKNLYLHILFMRFKFVFCSKWVTAIQIIKIIIFLRYIFYCLESLREWFFHELSYVLKCVGRIYIYIFNINTIRAMDALFMSQYFQSTYYQSVFFSSYIFIFKRFNFLYLLWIFPNFHKLMRVLQRIKSIYDYL